MKKNILYYTKIALALMLFLQVGMLKAQSFVTWNTTTIGSTSLTGTYMGGTILVTEGGSGNISLKTPSSSIGLNGATLTESFFGLAPNANAFSKSLTFSFSSPVKINELNIADIDQVSGSFDDSFTFSGITFTSVSGINCNYTLSGATPIGGSLAQDASVAQWLNSTTTVNSFTINFPVTNGVSTAGLFYSLKVSACNAGATAPTLSGTTLSNTCPANTVNLTSLVTSTLPSGASVKWFTDNTHTTVVADATMAPAGMYYAFYYDATNNCYSPGSAAVTATVAACCPVTSPTVN